MNNRGSAMLDPGLPDEINAAYTVNKDVVLVVLSLMPYDEP